MPHLALDKELLFAWNSLLFLAILRWSRGWEHSLRTNIGVTRDSQPWHQSKHLEKCSPEDVSLPAVEAGAAHPDRGARLLRLHLPPQHHAPVTTHHLALWGKQVNILSFVRFYYISHYHDQSDLFTCLHLVLGTITVYLEGVVGCLLPRLEISLQLLPLFLESDVLRD